MTPATEARDWLRHALRDLDSARILGSAESPQFTSALYHCQQAAEKAIKAFLVFHDRPFSKTHDLSDLRNECADADPELDTWIADAAPLTEYAWRFRYPGAPYEPDEAEYLNAVQVARALYEAILLRLPSEAHP